ncbi:probable LRR receptor-like serine/threonine-protein kinase RFK1 isoform X1 [Cynara cardunculus var. scolymus]|nr:probable LRR receptor-like serine/threonine-protein kinase RFK1 isoform X1 [Cynara cardunculus var. scolymus]
MPLEKMMSKVGYVLFLALNLIILVRVSDSVVPEEEVEALQEIMELMGTTNWRLNGKSCQLEVISEVQKPHPEADARVECDINCNNGNSSNCHVVSITHKYYSLGGVLPPDLVKLPHLHTIDFAFNYLGGTIPSELGSIPLQSISLLGNRFSGEIPGELGNITTLTYLNLEANNFSGTVPSELGRLINLQALILSSNRLTGTLPASFAELRNLKDFRISDNNFSGSIPNFIQNWRQISKLEMIGTGLQGPIPSNISLLQDLTDLRICEVSGSTQGFPSLDSATNLQTVVLRSCNISGEIPAYIWQKRDLQLLDVSFNKLVGGISRNIVGRSLRFVFLTGNMLSGDIPDTLLIEGATIDLSYNNFTWQGPDRPTCKPNMNLYLNLFRSSSTGNTLQDILPCTRDATCPKYGCSLHVNSGGDNLRVNENNVEVLYEGDASFDGSAGSFHRSTNNWGLSSTGDFLDDYIQTNRYVESLQGTNLTSLYTTARLCPLSLTYISYCLENGDYIVNLHFAEIQYTNDSTYLNLGRRIFDIYIQGQCVKRDFNIEDEVGIRRPVVLPFNASVINNTLEIRFYWAGKGTTRLPKRGRYGPLISAISINPYSKKCAIGGKTKKTNKIAYAGFALVGLCLLFIISAVLWWKRCSEDRKRNDKDFEGLEFKTTSFSFKQLKTATCNFNATSKIGEGGFGPVFKGTLRDGTIIAVKQLSSRSRQGNREFLNEIGMISCLQHPNLVKLHGCCMEGDQLLLVYEYLENNSLANVLFDSNQSRLLLDWPTRFKICVGIARGLAFLHEESRLKIVHRDIKATNVLLDKDLNPKISDFGLARLHEDENTHVSTRVAGTIGYMAPEYALWGHLSDKADVYSFGVVALEIVSGKNNNRFIPNNDSVCLLDWACRLQNNKHYEEIFDERLESKINREEAEIMVKVALMCTNGSPSMRPSMSEVVSMLEGRTCISDIEPEVSHYFEDLRFKSMGGGHPTQSSLETQYSATIQSESCLSPSDHSEIVSGEPRSY